jgi:hypothetical protein
MGHDRGGPFDILSLSKDQGDKEGGGKVTVLA